MNCYMIEYLIIRMDTNCSSSTPLHGPQIVAMTYLICLIQERDYRDLRDRDFHRGDGGAVPGFGHAGPMGPGPGGPGCGPGRGEYLAGPGPGAGLGPPRDRMDMPPFFRGGACGEQQLYRDPRRTGFSDRQPMHMGAGGMPPHGCYGPPPMCGMGGAPPPGFPPGALNRAPMPQGSRAWRQP
ncbi:hypothetical protein T492DRAFT_59979 [Pavlovales sp. CCMP2436]|nr:hypothetical protein T492DRAFT_59979 [Pavlovales sp. CCMP2436]